MFIETMNHNFTEIIILATSLLAIFGHNLILVGKKVSAETTKIEINTGDDFPSSESAISENRIAEFKVISETGEQKITDFTVEGTSLVATVNENQQTVFIAAVELLPHPISLEADRFGHYIEDENAQNFTAPHFIIGETTTPQRESYAKFAKVLIKNEAQNLEILNTAIGHKLEIILTELTNKNTEKLKVQVLFEGKPIGNLRVSSGAENFNGGKYSAHSRTDTEGFAEIEIPNGEHCFVRTHYIRRHSELENFEWESFWASVTFRR